MTHAKDAAKLACLPILLGLSLAVVATADEADDFFAAATVHEIRLYFDDPNWYETLLQGHASDPEDPYFPARFVFGDTVLEPVGVRFKGNSSFGIPTAKKSFKIDFDEFDEGGSGDPTTFLGLTKLNLNNSFKDPTMLREKLFLDFSAAYLPTIRAVHARVFVNDEYWGLYTAVEQIDMVFLRDRFGDEEDGNLFEGEAGDTDPMSAFGSDLTYLGPDPEPYYAHYQLKTNEAANDWSQLVELADVLNNTPAAELPEQLEPVFDVDSWLAALALNILYVNLDSYCGSAHNYFLYDRDASGQLTYLHWDANEAFGRFLMFMPPGQAVLEMDPFWLPQSPPPGQDLLERPLMSNLWAVEGYRRTYLRQLARMLREGFDATTVEARVTALADLIRDSVYADPHPMYPPADFERNLHDDIGSGQQTIFGLVNFVARRAAFMDQYLDGEAVVEDLRLNELMSVNLSTLADPAGDYDPWVEISNLGPGLVHTEQLYLSEGPGTPLEWVLPMREVDDGQRLLLWLDGEPAEGDDHSSFSLDPDGGELQLYRDAGGTPILLDSVTYPALAADHSLARLPDGEGEWTTTNRPTPGGANTASDLSAELVLNEVMADNATVVEDPDEPGAFEDWIELYNPSAADVDLAGAFLTDDLDDPTRWQVPTGLVVPAGGFLVIWADNDQEQGATHAGFRLDADGEELGLYAPDGVTLVDSMSYENLAQDQSYGRYPDGGSEWGYTETPTPGAANTPLRQIPPPRDATGRVGP